MKEHKKDFKDSKFNAFLQKALPIIGNASGAVIKFATGDVNGAIKEVGDMISKKAATGNPEATALMEEFETRKMDFLKEMYALEIQDRESARNRQVELAKTGTKDNLMPLAGYTALGTFVLMVIAVTFNRYFGLGLGENPLFHQLMGIIEGVALTVFAFYFGTSKSSQDKTGLIGK